MCFDSAYISVFQARDKEGNVRHNSQSNPKADGLVIHIHGGGFVAQSSKSHEVGLLVLSIHILHFLS